jgi:hypothetical protein
MKGLMAYDKQYYDGKRRDINIKYVKSMEELIADMGNTINKFYAYKEELNSQLTEINKREIEAGEGGEEATEQSEKFKEALAEEESTQETPEGESDGSEQA